MTLNSPLAISMPPRTRLMSITGFENNGPTRVGFAGADVMSGATAAFGVASALYQRTHTGKGQLVDVAMIDAVMGYLAQQFTEHMITGRVHEQAANLSVTRKPTGNLFKTEDGWIVLAVMTDPQFQRLMKVLPQMAQASDEDACWAVNSLTHTSTQLDPESREVLSRLIWGGDG